MEQIKKLSVQSEFYSDKCKTHRNKKAKYYIKISDRFCKKCALDKALNGELFYKYASRDSEIRKERIEHFMLRLFRAKKHCLVQGGKLIGRIREIHLGNIQQMEKVVHYFAQVQKIVLAEKTHFLNAIELKTQKAVREQENSHQLISRYSAEIQKFISDIDVNFDSIVEEMEMEPFNEIIDTYEKRLETIESQTNEIPKKGLTPDLLVENEHSHAKIREWLLSGLQFQSQQKEAGRSSLEHFAPPFVGNSPKFNQITNKSQESLDLMSKTMHVKASLESDFIKQLRTSNNDSDNNYCKFSKYIKHDDEIIIDQIEESSLQSSRQPDKDTRVQVSNFQPPKLSEQPSAYQQCLKMSEQQESPQSFNNQFKSRLQQQLQKHRETVRKPFPPITSPSTSSTSKAPFREKTAYN